MPSSRAFLYLLLMLCSTSALAASAKPAAGRNETLACRQGTEDRHARIAVVIRGGKTDSFAYYSKWKPRTCSIYVQRNRDAHSKWADSGAITTVNLEKGVFLIEHKPGEYHIVFRDIDRERYCGMDGVINGTLVIKRGSEECQLLGDIMVEGTPLGQANQYAEEEQPAVTTGVAAPPAEPAVAPAGPSATAVASPAAVPEAIPTSGASVQAITPPTTPPTTVSSNLAREPVQTPTAAPPPPAPPEKTAETPSSSPVRNFFRSLFQQRPSEPPPQ